MSPTLVSAVMIAGLFAFFALLRADRTSRGRRLVFGVKVLEHLGHVEASGGVIGTATLGVYQLAPQYDDDGIDLEMQKVFFSCGWAVAPSEHNLVSPIENADSRTNGNDRDAKYVSNVRVYGPSSALLRQFESTSSMLPCCVSSWSVWRFYSLTALLPPPISGQGTFRKTTASWLGESASRRMAAMSRNIATFSFRRREKGGRSTHSHSMSLAGCLLRCLGKPARS